MALAGWTLFASLALGLFIQNVAPRPKYLFDGPCGLDAF
jgi:hypothetical protein